MARTANVESRLHRRRGRRAATAGIDRVERDGPLPMSFGQEQMWFLDQLVDDSVEYLVPFALRIRGELDARALAQAWDALVARHEILRTRHVLDDGLPRQVIDEPVSGGLSMVSVADSPESGRGTRVNDLVAAQTATPFDLDRQWPARATLVEVTDSEHVLVVVFHHIACDAWSSRLALSDLWALYTAAKDGTEAALPELAVQYADFASWQRQQLTGGEEERQLAYWQEVLSGTPQLDLPTDFPRPPVRGYAGGEVEFTLPADVGAAVAGLARDAGTTPFAVLLTAFQAMLARYTGTADVPVGTIVSGRTRPELQHLVGNGINTVVIRTHWDTSVTFRELLRKVRGSVLDAFDHSAVPFASVVDKVQPQRDASRTPLYQTVFTWHEAKASPAEPAEGLVVEPIEAGGGVARCDVELQVGQAEGGGLDARLIYATDLFERDTVERMAAHLTRLLSGAVSEPDTPLHAVAMLGETELASLTVPAEPMPDGALADHALGRFDRQVTRTPDAAAVVTDEGTVTFAELGTRVNGIAHRLREAGAGEGDVVGILHERGVGLLASMLASWRVGAAYLALDPELPQQRWGWLLTDSAARVVVTDGESDRNAALGEVFDGTILSACEVTDGAGPEFPPPRTCDPEALAYVVYTSGSTGRPKGVGTTHRGLLTHLNWVIDNYIGDHEGGAPLFSTVAGDVVVPTLFAPLLAGRPVHMLPQDIDLSELGPRLAVAKPFAFIKLTPGHLEMLSHQLDPADIDGLAGTVVTGGDVLLDSVARQWDDWLGDGRLVNEYGPTEITVGNSTYLPGSGSRREVVPIGKPIPHTSMYVLDETLRPAAPGVIGEICVGGDGLARGYLNRPSQTADTFVPDPYGPPGARLYRTGDLGRVVRGGDVEFAGRVDDQVKIRGHRVELGEVEGLLSGRSEVAECRVVLRGERDQPTLVAYAVGADADERELSAWLTERLPEYMVPQVVLLDRIPLTANGKLDVDSLPERTGPVVDFVAPRNAIEQRIADVWSEALQLERVGVHDGFFDVGGDSIRAVAVVGALRHAGHDLTVADVFANGTVARLAELLDGRGGLVEDRGVAPFALIGEADRAAVPGGVEDAYPLSRNQVGMIFEMLADEQNPYHCTTTFWIRDGAPFSLDAMTESARLLSRRHEVLRTSLHLSGFSVPMQLVHTDARMAVSMRDMRGMSSDEIDLAVKEHVAHERANLFDMTVPGLMRFVAFPTDHDGYWLSITECHPVQEGWGYHSMVMELLNCYGALRRGEEPPPYEKPEVRFADFVAGELASIESEEDAGYWRDIVTEYVPFALPEEWHDRTALLSKHQAMADWRDLKPRLREAAANAGVSMKCVMVSAFTKVLSQLTDEDAFHFGLITDARPERLGADTVYGMYLNTLPFAVRRPSGTWRDLLRATFDREVELWPHRRYPYPEIVRTADHRRRLVEVMFNYHDFNQVDKELVAERVGLDDSPTDFGLTVSTRVDLVMVTADYRYLGPEQAELIARAFRRVLEAIAEDIDTDATISVLPEPHRRWLLDQAQEPADPAGRAEPVRHALEAFDRQVERTPQATAVRCGDEELTFAELDRWACRIAERLRRHGFTPGSVAGVLVGRDLNLLPSLLATWKAGGAYVPLDAALPADRLSYALADSGACCVLAAPALAAAVPATFDGSTVLVAADSREADAETADAGAADAGAADAGAADAGAADAGAFDAGASESRAFDAGAAGGEARVPEQAASPEGGDGAAYVIYTSGSTGRPKGVRVSHRSLANYLSWAVADYVAAGDGGAPLLSTVASDLPVTTLFAPLLAGQPVHVLSDDLDLSELGAALRAGGPYSFIKLTPGHLEVLGQQLDTPVAETIVVGGEALHRPVVRRWAERLCEGRVINEYGLTETTVGNSVAVVGDGERPVVPIGKPIPNTSIHVLDARLELLPRGAVGEVCVAGEGLATGYENRPAMTAERFVPNPYGPPGSRLYRTGDLGRVLADGSVDLLGRRDGQVKIRGYRVELGEIESVLGEHPLIAEARVLLRTGSGDDRRLVAYVVPESGDEAVAAEPVRAWLADRLPEYMVPAVVVQLDRLPLTANGKLDTDALPETGEEEPGDSYIPPEGPLEQRIAEIWGEVLGKRVGAADEFGALGGDSIRAVALTGALTNAGYSVSVRELFTHPTVSRLARLLADRHGHTPAPKLDEGAPAAAELDH
ncbi:non-ribosomal peptide synthetase [Prauserella alba]|uniref:Carrier domain-containing protein n=1 Tax=Prauserella alba TaxID=176898 RepID=A0ABN1VMM4_9PSEU|nr:non-ribosomal peptide synthetase [Prauserella alba]MCP2180821.1 amino acid adenylation domain-containing protein [Prauserella alba]